MKRRKMENRLRKTINDVPLQIQQVVVPPDKKPIKQVFGQKRKVRSVMNT